MQARVFRASDERERPRSDSGHYRSPRSNQTVLARHNAGDSRTTLRGVHTDSGELRQTEGQAKRLGGAIVDPTARGCFDTLGRRRHEDVFTTFTAAAGRNIFTVTADRRRVTPLTSGGLSSFPASGTHPLALRGIRAR